MKIKICCVLGGLLSLLWTCQPQQERTASENLPDLTEQRENGKIPLSDSVSSQHASLTYTLIPAPENTYGYIILKAGRPFIQQPHIPGMAGVKGFRTEEQAHKTAQLVIYKIQQRIIPPTVSREELDSLGVLD